MMDAFGLAHYLAPREDGKGLRVTEPLGYLGFSIGDEWVVGYGLDYAEHNRTLPYIGVVKPTD